MPPVIRIEQLSKSYRIAHNRQRGPYRTLREALGELASAPLRRLRGMQDDRIEEFWALNDVNLEVQQGEVVGIIGRNGAGKSTLLKIVSRITAPTHGRAELRGRVGSLLEVGTGFHPELTGRENIFLNGSILGMSRREIRRKFDEIVDFSGVEKFLDTPVKRYSSGMYVRLAFAVAAHLDPEILIVDEVLAVGDAEFQKKCLGKMKDIGNGGRTVLFVSHSMGAVENLCSRVVVLKQGSISFAGQVSDGIEFYVSEMSRRAGGFIDLGHHPARRRGSIPLLKGVRFIDAAERERTCFATGETMTIELTVDPLTSIESPQFGIGVDDWMGTRVFSLATFLSDSVVPPIKDRCVIRCTVDVLPLVAGHYSLSLSAGSGCDLLMDAIDNAVELEVQGSDFYGNGRAQNPSLGRVAVRSAWSAARS
jgi:lipopolysaccharide transport system ATP-binding protein